MADLIPIFPTTLYKDKLSRNLTTIEIDTLSKFQGLPSDFGNTQSADGSILDQPSLVDLKQECEKHLNRYYRDILKADDTTEIYITDSWINFSRKGDQHSIHTHVNSMLSGVVYLQVNESVPSISFTKDSPFLLLEFPVTEQNEFNSPSWKLDVNNNDIVIFPSNVWHSVPTNPSDTPRVTLAFNSFIRGNLLGTDLTI